jgi:ATP/maltotriose-dependent transcriptional regulator MalT/DNA-binding SARP family transcriptional activator
MTVIPLVYTQLVPPRVKNSIKRDNLRGLGLAVLSHRVTTVVAPAGYGKSVWVSSLLDDPMWPPSAWLSLDNHDSEPAFLLCHLIQAIQKVVPEFGGQALRTIKSLEDVGRDWQIAVSSLIEEIPVNKEVVLVLDDFHLIDTNRSVCRILEYLIHWLPPASHLVLISRQNPSLNLYKEQLSGELLQIACEQLRFSIEETSELLSLLGFNLADRDIEFIYAYTEGWAAVLRLLGILLKKWGGDFKKALAASRQKDADLYSYLNNELLGTLDQDLQDFLLDSSLLPYLEPDLCNAALECAGSEQMINILHSQGLFSRVEGETVTWRLHHLMGEFLENKAALYRSPEYMAAIRRRAAHFLKNKGDIDRSLEQLVACADWAAARDIIRDYSDQYYIQGGRLNALNSWIGRLPEDLVNNSHWLLYYRGRSILHTREEEALATLSRAAYLAEARGDVSCQVRSLLAMFMVYAFANKVNKIREIVLRIPRAASLVNNSWSEGIVLVAELGRAAWEDNLKQGENFSWLAGLARLDAEFRLAYLIFSFIIQCRLGNLNSARQLITRLMAEPYVQDNEVVLGEIYVAHAFFCMLSGDYQQLADISRDLLRLGEKYNSPHQLGFAHRSRACLYFREGRYDEARAEFGLSQEQFIRANNLFYAELTNLDLIYLRVRAGENAAHLWPETGPILDRLRSSPGGQGLDDYVCSLAGIMAMEAGQMELARQRFEELRQRCSENGARHVQAGAQFFLARLYLLRGDENNADSCLVSALSAAETEKWDYFWNWHEETMYAMCRHALLKKIHPSWAISILSRRFPQRTCQEAGSLLLYPGQEVCQGIASIVSSRVQATGVPVIHVNCLGGFQVFVNGVEVKQSQWRTKKAANLFKYLLIAGGKHPKEKIIEELWPGAEPRRGDASLRMTLTYARKALGLNDRESIFLRRGMLYINPEIEIYTDYEWFASLADSSVPGASSENPIRVDSLEQAMQLYRGEFLPDNIYDDWSSSWREHLRQLYLQVVLALIQSYRQQDSLPQAIQACRRYLALEPADEPVCRAAMEMLWASGQKQHALSLYQDLADFMASEYNAVPSSETSSLYRKILTQ